MGLKMFFYDPNEMLSYEYFEFILLKLGIWLSKSLFWPVFYISWHLLSVGVQNRVRAPDLDAKNSFGSKYLF